MYTVFLELLPLSLNCCHPVRYNSELYVETQFKNLYFQTRSLTATTQDDTNVFKNTSWFFLPTSTTPATCCEYFKRDLEKNKNIFLLLDPTEVPGFRHRVVQTILIKWIALRGETKCTEAPGEKDKARTIKEQKILPRENWKIRIWFLLVLSNSYDLNTPSSLIHTVCRRTQAQRGNRTDIELE